MVKATKTIRFCLISFLHILKANFDDIDYSSLGATNALKCSINQSEQRID